MADDKNTIRGDILKKSYWLFAFFVAIGIAVVVKIIYIQTRYINSESSTVTMRDIIPIRGDILSSDGRILATSMPTYYVFWDFTVPGLSDTLFNKNIDSLSKCMSKLFGDMTPEQYKDKFIKGRKAQNTYFPVKSGVTFSQIGAMRKFPIFSRGRYRSGFIVERRSVRKRPHKGLALRTIGSFTDARNDGGKYVVGLEGRYNAVLSGHIGHKLCEKLPSGHWRPLNPYDDPNEIEPEDGADIVSTINVDIQDIVEEALVNQLTKYHAKYGCAVVMEVKTGRIRAISNRELCDDGTYGEIYNHAVGSSFEPGSTFKLASMITVLEKLNLNIDDKIDLHDGKFRDGLVTDDHTLTGMRTIREIFEKSSNVGMAYLCDSAFHDKESDFLDRLFDMHIDKVTGVDVAGEPDPDFKYTDHKNWWSGSMAKMSYGYEMRMTPLQILTFYNAVANNATMMRPRLLESVRRHGEVVETITPEIICSSICSNETLQKVKDLLVGVVERGTASNIKSNNYKIAGKTGTAQIAQGALGYTDANGAKSYMASFVGYFPADNPKYSCIVVVSTPKQNSYYGSTVAAPVFKMIADKLYSRDRELHSNTNFNLTSYADKGGIPNAKNGDREILDRLFSSFNIPMSNVENAQTPYVSTLEERDHVVVEPIGGQRGYVPDVRGMGLRDAMYLLRKANLKVSVVGRGTVKKQSLSPSSEVKSGQTIIIELG
jgi:cell division protein FtsI (penicillin-binding protein 3)